MEKHGIACDMLHGSDWGNAVGDCKKTLFALPTLKEHLLELEDGKDPLEPGHHRAVPRVCPLRGQR